ncbi:MAG TPA: hypothetical protein VF266_03525 [Thermoanaerobaculia bacterium]
MDIDPAHAVERAVPHLLRGAVMKRVTALLLLTLTAASAVAEPARVVVFTMDEQGRVKPHSYFLRERELAMRSESELAAVVAGERKHPPGEKGHIAVRARNRWGQVVYRTLVEVVLTGESTCCPHVPVRIEPPSFVVIVPQGARSVSLEGWRPESTARFVFRGDRID